MNFVYKDRSDYIEAYTYMLRVGEGFEYLESENTIIIAPLDNKNGTLVYDKEIVERLAHYNGEVINKEDNIELVDEWLDYIKE